MPLPRSLKGHKEKEKKERERERKEGKKGKKERRNLRRGTRREKIHRKAHQHDKRGTIQVQAGAPEKETSGVPNGCRQLASTLLYVAKINNSLTPWVCDLLYTLLVLMCSHSINRTQLLPNKYLSIKERLRKAFFLLFTLVQLETFLIAIYKYLQPVKVG